jgi:hypothetical protein
MGTNDMEEMTCPKCEGIKWVVYASLFETGGTLIELQAECTTENCGTRMELGVVDGKDITPVT